MGKAFKKGDRVTRISDWDGKGTVSIQEAIVYSCGAKRLILTYVDTGKEFRRDFRAERSNTGDRLTGRGLHWAQGLIFPALDRDEAITIALECGQAIADAERANYRQCIETHPDDEGYIRSIKKSIEALHEPRHYIWEF